MPKLKCAMTGATGYLGGHLVKNLEAAHFDVITLSRKQPQTGKWVQWDFNRPIDSHIFQEVDVLIHCAWDMTLSTKIENEQTNIAGSIRLLEQAKAAGTPMLIFISSSSVFDGMKTVYGHAKKKVEEKVLELGGMIIRPGLVYGTPLGGILLKLEGLVKKLPVLPLLGGGQQKFVTVHVDDLCRAIMAMIVDPSLYDKHALVLGHSRLIPFRKILESLEQKNKIKRMKIPCPWKFLYFFLRLLERSGFKPPLKSDSLLSLMNLDPEPHINPYFLTQHTFRDYEI